MTSSQNIGSRNESKAVSKRRSSGRDEATGLQLDNISNSSTIIFTANAYFYYFFYCAETSAEVSLVWQVPTSPDTSVSVCTCHMWHVYFSFLVLTRRCLRALPTLPVTTGSQVNSQSCSNVATATVYRGQTAYSDRIRNSAAKQYFFFLPNLEKNTFHDLRHSSETILANDSWLFIKKMRQ